jgi:YidC/Oxa1 family membrane protein insertase
MKDENTRNTILAIALSLIVLLVWQFLVVNPRVEQEQAARRAQQAQQAQQTQQPQAQPGGPAVAPSGPAAQPGAVPGAPVAPAGPALAIPGITASRESALAAAPRVQIDTPRVSGSISLRGGRIDDLTLRDYRETVDRNSPNVSFFHPQGARNPWFADVGFVAPQGAAIAVPSPQTLWRQEGSGPLTPATPVVLVWDNGQGLTFRRTYAIDANFMFTITDEVRNTGTSAASVHPYALIQRDGTPPTSNIYILHEGMIGVLGTAGLREITYSDLDKTRPPVERQTTGWLGITDKYWAAAVIPDQTTPYEGHFISQLVGTQRSYQALYLKQPHALQPGTAASTTHRIFAGAKEVRVVEGYHASQRIDRFELMIDWGWFYFFTKPLFWALDYFFHLFGNFGVSIIVVTLIIKLVFFPLANKSYESMARMKKIQPEMLAIRERFAEDKMKQQQAMMDLYKKEKINPLSGCWPVLIQIPIFFALYKVLFVSIEMRQAPFFGWIRDLSAHDPTSIFNLFGLLPFAVPEFFQIGVWPIIMGITMWVQMKMNPDPPDQIQKMIFSWMPLVFTFMLASFPAGLVIYWAWNNVLSVAQQGYCMKKNGVKIELMDNLRGMFKKKPAAST